MSRRKRGRTWLDRPSGRGSIAIVSFVICVGLAGVLGGAFMGSHWLLSNGWDFPSVLTVGAAGAVVGGCVVQITNHPLQLAFGSLAARVDQWRVADLSTDLDVVGAISGQTPAVTVDMRPSAAALEDLVRRLWAGDRPASDHDADIETWVADLPQPQAAALNAVLRQRYGTGVDWDSEHPISLALLPEEAR